MIQTAKNRENDALIPYGKDIKRVLETIKKMRWYGDEPLGPLGWILDGIVSNISYIPPVAHSRPTTFQVTLSWRANVGWRCGNLWVYQGGVYNFYEVILVDHNHKAVCPLVLVSLSPECFYIRFAEIPLTGIIDPVHKYCEDCGLTNIGKHDRVWTLCTWHFQCEARLQASFKLQVVQVHSSRLSRQSTKSAYGRLMTVPFRAKLAELVSPLRRVRSKTPFFELAARRIPTLWSLYRGLLRNSPTEDVFLTCIFLCIRAYTTIFRRSRFV